MQILENWHDKKNYIWTYDATWCINVFNIEYCVRDVQGQGKAYYTPGLGEHSGVLKDYNYDKIQSWILKYFDEILKLFKKITN